MSDDTRAVRGLATALLVNAALWLAFAWLFRGFDWQLWLCLYASLAGSGCIAWAVLDRIHQRLQRLERQIGSWRPSPMVQEEA